MLLLVSGRIEKAIGKLMMSNPTQILPQYPIKTTRKPPKNHQKTTQKPPKKTHENHLKTQSILSEIEKNPYISRVDLSQLLRLTINQIRGYLENLKKENVITRIGSNRKGYWEINDVRYYPNTNSTPNKKHPKTTQKPPEKPPENHLKTQCILSEIEKNPYISRVDLSQLLGLTINQIRGRLENLVKKSVIRRVGSNRSGYWELVKDKN